MKLLPLLVVAFLSAAWARGADLPAMKAAALKGAEARQVEALLDQPYAGNDNPRQKLDLYLPKVRKSDKPLPVVAAIHGGGWVNGDRIGGATAAITRAAQGEYAAVSIGYRMSTEAHWPAQIYDCKAAIRWIRAHAKQYNLDPTKIAVMGGSAGGHLSSLLGTSGEVKELEGSLGSWASESSRVTCVVNLCGPEDFTKPLMFDKTGQPVVKDPAVSGLLGGTFEEKPAEARAASPITYVSADDPPFLSAHGTKDERVAFAHAEAIHAALQKAGVSSLLIPLTNGGHGGINTPGLKPRIEQFLDLHLRGIPATISSEPILVDPKP